MGAVIDIAPPRAGLAAAMTDFTVLGAGGFIGAALVGDLRARGYRVHAVTRADMPELLAQRRQAGHVVCCIGLTADFRTRRLATAEAHVGLVARLLAELDFQSFLFLSSTRVYARAELGREDVALEVQPSALGDLYNITKLAGEALCLSDPRPGVRVARLSNVYGVGMGEDSFLGQILAEGMARGEVTLRKSLRSTKDYVALADVITALRGIAECGLARLYNVASGFNTTHDAVLGVLAQCMGWRFTVRDDAAALRFPRIDVTRLSTEFTAPIHSLLDDLPWLAGTIRQEARC
jgi:nucleoside-diphosphate-sugar epimerase